MDGRSGDGSTDSDECQRAPGSDDGASESPDGTGSSTEKTGWPYEPDVSVGEATASGADVGASLEETSDPEVASVFWRVVLLVDVALLCLTIGPLLAVVRDSPGRGLGLFALGLVALGYAYYLYRDYRDGDDEDFASTGDDETGDPTSTGDDGATEDDGDDDGTEGQTEAERNG